MQDKERIIREAARRVFSKRGYKAASIAEIAKEARVAVGSFYNYYPSKDEIFIEVYIDENNRVRQRMIDEVDWAAQPMKLVRQLFDYSFQHVSTNKILSEWGNPAISGKLHAHYLSDEGKEDYPFHRFLVETFARRMAEAGFAEEKIGRVLQAYELIYFVDMHVTEQDFPGYALALETLVTYFVKGLFEQE